MLTASIIWTECIMKVPDLSEGTRTVILTVGLAAAAAVLFPVKDEEGKGAGA